MGKYTYFVNKGKEVVFKRENDLNWYKGIVSDYRIDIFNPQLSNINLTDIVALSSKGDKLVDCDFSKIKKLNHEDTQIWLDGGRFIEIKDEIDLSNIPIDFLDLGKVHVTYRENNEELNYTHFGEYRMSIREMIAYKDNGGDDIKLLEFLVKLNSALNKISTNALTMDFFDVVNEKSIDTNILIPSTEVFILKDNKPKKMNVLKAFVDIDSLETDKYLHRTISKRHGITYGLVSGNEYFELSDKEVFKNQTEMFNYLRALIKEL